jgi:hypothetical protein
MFSEALELELQLTIGEKLFKIPGGHIKDFQVQLLTYGFNARVQFWVECLKKPDPFFRLLTKAELATASLTIKKHHNVPDSAPDPIAVTGIVTEKQMVELTVPEIKGEPVIHRGYTLVFQDAASVLWSQHFPVMLYSDAKLVDIIKAQLCDGVKFDLKWKELKRKHLVVCLGLEEARNGASFYDFVLWYVDRFAGILEYDSKTNKYALLDKKTVPTESSAINRLETSRVSVLFPEVTRHDVKILNAYSEKSDKKDVKKKHSVTGIRRDVLMRSEVPAQFTRLQSFEKSRCIVRESELSVLFREYPTCTLRPGLFVEFSKHSWPSSLYQSGKDFRVVELQIRGTATKSNPEFDREQIFADYSAEMSIRCESKTEARFDLPEYRLPCYPVVAEGHIVSELGGKEDKTYQIYTDPDTSLEYFKVNIPLWNKKVLAPFAPNVLSSQFYFPAFRNSRVLVEFGFLGAEIKGFLDWAPEVRLAMSAQGNHILFGHNPTSQTSLSHLFKDNKPQWTLKRIAGQDTEMIQLDEGTMIFQTKEDKSLKKGSSAYSVVAQVLATKAELGGKAGAAIASLSGQYESSSGETTAAIEGAIGDVGGALEEMDGAVSGKVQEARGAVTSSLSALSAKTGALRSAAAGIGSELRALGSI